MGTTRMCDSEYRFIQVVWDTAPIASGQLVELCGETVVEEIHHLYRFEKTLHARTVAQ